MKITSILSVCLLTFLVFSSVSLAQEMKPEAGKLYNAGNDMLKAGNYNGAIDSYDKALQIEKDYRIYYQKGQAQKKAGSLDAAKSSFEESIKLKSDFEAGYNALGGVYFSLGNFEAAIKNFEKVMEISKDNKTKNKVKTNLSLAYSKMGTTAMSDGNVNKAVEYLQKAVTMNNYDAAYLSLAKLYSETGDWDKSISAAENALKYKSGIPKGGPYFYMGISYKGKGDITKAKEMFTLAKSDATYKKTAEYELSILN
ncbi:MAG: tetratricopeptide repeat protein [Ignavibacteriales bacterium]|nr:MAG: tetratricopeptide repeat protein [Ignavibacteriales bacterium]